MRDPRALMPRSFFSSQVLEHLRKKIISGEIPAGENIVETKIASEMNVSRGPVRNALFILENEGLVSFLSNGRTKAVGFSLEDAATLYETRVYLEVKAIELIFQKKQKSFEHLRKINQELKTEMDHVEKFTNLDINFHYELMYLSGNKYLLQCWVLLRPVLETVLLITNTMARKDASEQWDKSYVSNHHDKILEALLLEDITLAVMSVKEHLSIGKSIMMKKLEELLKT